MAESLNVIARVFGKQAASLFQFILIPDTKESQNEYYTIQSEHAKVTVYANSLVAFCRGAYDFLKNHCKSTHQWSGICISIPQVLPIINKTVTSPYQFHYYLNVVTNGYSTPYWDWNRWEKEIDWMATHGINMPLISGAHEAILNRVFLNIGFKKEEINEYFTGPVYFPWNRLGNLSGVHTPVPESYFPKQIELYHKILNRMRALGMTPIVHSFSGFVPKSIKRLYPTEEIKEVIWGADVKKENWQYILSPTSELFSTIGKMFIVEWEKEFGKNIYYLADCLKSNPILCNTENAEVLTSYGKAIYKSIEIANPDSVLVLQGWIFGSNRGQWLPNKLKWLISAIPDDKLLIIDMAIEYNMLKWKTEPCWKKFDGFYGKKWIFSFTPNMGGNTSLNGILEFYTETPIQALNNKSRGQLVGYGCSPEGIENNELLYELIFDMGWEKTPIDLDKWYENYCNQRYGCYSKEFANSFNLLRKSCFGNFVSIPLCAFQLNPYRLLSPGVDQNYVNSKEYMQGVVSFLRNSEICKYSKLYVYDCIELVAEALELQASALFSNALFKKSGKEEYISKGINLLMMADKLLESHPILNLRNCVEFARSWGNNEEEKNYYEADAKRLLTIWEFPNLSDYAGRSWAGLIRDYYVPRWKQFQLSKDKHAIAQWENEWFAISGISETKPYQDPLIECVQIMNVI